MNQRFKECLLEVYHSEITGEVIFESMLQNAKNSEERFIFGSMLQLETEAKAIMRPTLVHLDLKKEEKLNERFLQNLKICISIQAYGLVKCFT